MNKERMLKIFKDADAAWKRMIENNRKATWLDITRHPEANFYCMQAEEHRQEAFRAKAIWDAESKGLTPQELLEIVFIANGATEEQVRLQIESYEQALANISTKH